jgi:hypothetical protein
MLNVNWIRVRRLCGETMREIGILVFVFAPLETVLADQPVSRAAVMLVMLGSVTLIAAGVVLEARE